MDNVEHALSWIANVIQIGTAIFAIVVLLSTRRRLTQWISKQKRASGSAPAALAIGLAGGIRGQVEQYLKAQGMDMPVEDLDHPEFVPMNRYPLLMRELLKKKDELTKTGLTELHLFYKGPVSLAAGIGAVFDNWVPVHLYEFKDGTYHRALTIEKESVRGLLPETLAEGEELVMRAMQS
ncbi:SAVED domain-containing protein [Candidatus Amarolinea aalborgensis]|uniref:SAVED domain-containing protein n=1 Tax=Candidatus Amarolinea aalborgensis TaxID=2249329 RepID=UPI003BF9F3B6